MRCALCRRRRGAPFVCRSCAGKTYAHPEPRREERYARRTQPEATWPDPAFAPNENVGFQWSTWLYCRDSEDAEEAPEAVDVPAPPEG